MVLHDGPLSKEHIQTLKNRIDNNDFVQAQAGSVEENTLFSNEYIGMMSEETRITSYNVCYTKLLRIPV